MSRWSSSISPSASAEMSKSDSTASPAVYATMGYQSAVLPHIARAAQVQARARAAQKAELDAAIAAMAAAQIAARARRFAAERADTLAVCQAQAREAARSRLVDAAAAAAEAVPAIRALAAQSDGPPSLELAAVFRPRTFDPLAVRLVRGIVAPAERNAGVVGGAAASAAVSTAAASGSSVGGGLGGAGGDALPPPLSAGLLTGHLLPGAAANGSADGKVYRTCCRPAS